MSPLFYAVGASGRENLRRGVNDFALQNYKYFLTYANLFAIFFLTTEVSSTGRRGYTRNYRSPGGPIFKK